MSSFKGKGRLQKNGLLVGCQKDVTVETIKYFSEDECKDIKSLPLKDNTFIAHFIINARCC